MLEQQLPHSESGEKLSTFTRLLGVREVPTASVVPCRRDHGWASWRRYLQPCPDSSTGLITPVLAAGLCRGSAWGCSSLRLRPWSTPASAARACTGIFCTSWSNVHNTSCHRPWSSWFLMEMLPAELPLLLSNTLQLTCLILYGLYEIAGDF